MRRTFEQTSHGEIANNARRLVEVKGVRALDYARHMAGIKKKAGDKNEQRFWKGIADEVEHLINGPAPERD